MIHIVPRLINDCKEDIHTCGKPEVLLSLREAKSEMTKMIGKENNMKIRNEKWRRWQGSYLNLILVLSYNEKSITKLQDMNRTVVYVNAEHTWQKCSKCEYIHKNKREGNIFHSLKCNFELHADLYAARNI